MTDKCKILSSSCFNQIANDQGQVFFVVEVASRQDISKKADPFYVTENANDLGMESNQIIKVVLHLTSNLFIILLQPNCK